MVFATFTRGHIYETCRSYTNDSHHTMLLRISLRSNFNRYYPHPCWLYCTEGDTKWQTLKFRVGRNIPRSVECDHRKNIEFSVHSRVSCPSRIKLSTVFAKNALFLVRFGRLHAEAFHLTAAAAIFTRSGAANSYAFMCWSIFSTTSPICALCVKKSTNSPSLSTRYRTMEWSTR